MYFYISENTIGIGLLFIFRVHSMKDIFRYLLDSFLKYALYIF